MNKIANIILTVASLFLLGFFVWVIYDIFRMDWKIATLIFIVSPIIAWAVMFKIMRNNIW